MRALRALGHDVRVVAAERGDGPPEDIEVAYRSDSWVALARLVARHPVASARDLLDRRRWRRDEHVRPLRSLAPVWLRLRAARVEHLHAHFAMASALDALRLARFLGVPYSVTAHAYDIFQTPANLAEKLELAAFATTGCDYNLRHLRTLTGARVERIVMGVDGERFRRRTPYPAGRTVVAVGRLVEKKGFAHLVRAAALLRERGAADRVVIAGDGPLRAELARLAGELGLDGYVELLGAVPHAEVRTLLERADVLAMPSVVAADGDRDSMPVVVKEALAMEVPVVGSDEVGLPEVLREPWGVLVAPGDPAALAQGLADLLARPAEQRAEAGRAGRRFVLEHADVHRETARLAALITSARR